MVKRVKTAMSLSARKRQVVFALVGVAVAALMVSTVSTGVAGRLGAMFTPQSTSTDPVLYSSWSGYGVFTKSPNSPIVDVLGSWVVPNVTCPQPNASAAYPYALASEAIGVGLDHYGSPANLKMDGVGVVIACALGNAVYRAFVQQAPLAAVLLPFPVKPGDVFEANVTLSKWVITDLTTPGGAAGLWSTSVSVAVVHNSAECVVSRTPALGVLPAVFKPVPATVPTALTNPVEFGSLYATPSPAVGPADGCWYSSPAVTGAPGPWMGIGNAPSPPFLGITFEMLNPNVANVIAPGPLSTGILLDDSFVVP